jgi:acyl-CoA thioesterase YciA
MREKEESRMDSAEPRGEPAIRVMMMPRDTNAHGTIFGGVLLSYLDQAGALVARRHAPRKFVTVALDKVEFKEPVFVGDVLSFFGSVVREGRTSITIRIAVFAERFTAPGTCIHVTEANAVFVAVGSDGRPVPIRDS